MNHFLTFVRRSTKYSFLLGFSLAVSSFATLSASDTALLHLPVWNNPKYGIWHSALIGGGGYLLGSALCSSDRNRVYAYGDMDGVFRSDDGGISWRMIHGGLPGTSRDKGCSGNGEFAGLTVDPRNADRLAIATGFRFDEQGVYVSSDGGTTWTKTLDAQFMGNGPYRWAGSRLVRDDNNPDVILAASSGKGVWLSRDNGVSWQDSGLQGYLFTHALFDRTNGKRAWLCGIPDPVSFQDHPRLKGGFFRTGDGGQTWTQLSDESPFSIVQDPVAPSTLYGIFAAGTRASPESRPGNRIKRSTDAGQTWQNFDDGLPIDVDHSRFGQDHSFLTLSAGPSFVLTASEGTGTLYKLEAGKSRWTKIEREAFDLRDWRQPYYVEPGMAASSIVVDPQRPDHWLLTDFSCIYQTWDAGKVWRACPRGLELTVVHTIAVDPQNPALILIGLADAGLWRSVDGGETYVPVLPHGGMDIKSIAFSPKEPNRVFAVGGMYQATDRLFVSTDGGLSWEPKLAPTGLPEKPTCASIMADPVHSGVLYLPVAGVVGPGKGGLYRSTDNAHTWTWFGKGLPVGQPFFSGYVHGSGGQLAEGIDGTLMAVAEKTPCIYRCGGTEGTWTAVAWKGKGRLSSISADVFTEGRFYLTTKAEGILRTDDNGQTWKKISAQGADSIAVDRNITNRVAAGTKDGVILSLDGGQTWTALDKSLPNRFYNRVAFAGNRLHVGSIGNGMFWTEAPSRSSPKAKPLP